MNEAAGATPASVGIYAPQSTNEHNQVTMEMGPIREVDVSVPASSSSGLDAGLDDNFNLKKFLSRPVQIDTFTWAEGASISSSISPLKVLVESTSISRKLDGYSRLRCSLNVEIVVNASPYQYGALFTSLKPSGGNYGNIDRVGGARYKSFESETLCIGQMSMLPNGVVVPAENSSVKLSAPFVFPNEWIDLTDRGAGGQTDFAFSLAFRSLGPLRTASSEVGNPLTINVFAWMTDVQIMGPSQIAVNGMISDTASAVANAAGALTSVPTIGPYATAAEVVARATSTVARFFGFSHPVPNIPIEGTIIDPTPSFASAHTSNHMNVLSLDPGNGMTVGSGPLGYELPDEMVISNICSRPAVLTQGLWTAAAVEGSPLFTACVTPSLVYSEGLSGTGGQPYNVTNFPPTAFAAYNFAFWRGDMTFTLRFFPSKFHRGKIRVLYDPAGLPGITDPTLIQTKVVDISESATISFEVPYMSNLAWLQNDDPTLVFIPGPTTSHWAVQSSSGLDHSSTYHNGVIRFEVLNSLTGPNNLADVPFVVYVHSNSMEFSLPQEHENLVSGRDMISINGLTDNPPGPTSGGDHILRDDTKLNLTYMGEKVVSLRDLIKRTTLVTTLATDPLVTRYENVRFQAIMRRTPMPPLFNTDGFPYEVSDFAGTGNVSASLTKMTPLCWIGMAFIGVRGGYMWKFVPKNTEETFDIKLTRYHKSQSEALAMKLFPAEEITGAFATSSISTPAYLSTTAPYYSNSYLNDKSNTGTALALPNVIPTVSALVPMYSQNKWYTTQAVVVPRPGTTDNTPPDTDQGYDNMILTVDYKPKAAVDSPSVIVDAYCAAADDLSMVFFCGLPPIYTGGPPKPSP